ncbi:26S proteasome non-ATPase regulatory subunit 6 [Geodia barretti]|uniref:26S proteasome non-ATPase regulatory subunit 6 n=1 Tax=Geodia barretti TaxID=519541 RepID=A0AA35X9D3_GEOBA|nr:26S proteasome non-ATPase regulatory subunit 6 [Geodia barretti]
MPMESVDEEGLPKNPDLQLVQWRFLLSADDSVGVNKNAIWDQLLEAIKENDMAPFYESVCAETGWTVDPDLLAQLKSANEKKLVSLEEAIEDSEKNFGETEQKEALQAKAEYLCRAGHKEAAESAFRATFEKTVGLGYRMDLVFYLIRLGLFYMDHDLITRNIQKAKLLVEEGGDWDRRNRLKTYEGLYAMSIRDFGRAATCFFDTMATFTSTELMDYQTFVKYACFCCLVALDRSDVKSKIIEGADILEVLHGYPELREFVLSLYNCQYDKFFRTLIWLEQEFLKDRYLAAHTRYYIRQMRVKAYTQLLESYRSLSLSHMAATFGVSVQFIDRELSQFISAGRLHCKIDKVGGVVVTMRPDSKNFQYQSTIKQGDLLLNRVQKLSRVIHT